MRATMVSFRMEGVESLALQRHLSRTARIRTRVIGEYVAVAFQRGDRSRWRP